MMTTKTMEKQIRLDWCSHQAAKYACETWHYSKKIPSSKLAKIGVWEDNEFIGCVIFGVGAGNSTDGRQYGLKKRFEVAELQRVALKEHTTPTSKIVAIAIKMVHKAFPKIRLLTSFADTGQGHVGTIYQATGWVFVGAKIYKDFFEIGGERVHTRTVHDRGWRQSEKWLQEHIDPNTKRLSSYPKNHYLYPLDNKTRTIVEKLKKGYPKKIADLA